MPQNKEKKETPRGDPTNPDHEKVKPQGGPEPRDDDRVGKDKPRDVTPDAREPLR